MTVTLLHHLSLFLSIASLFVVTYLYNAFLSYNPDLYGVLDEILVHPQSYHLMVLTCAIPLLLELSWRGFARDLRPSYTEILQEKMRLQKRENQADYNVVVQTPQEEHKWQHTRPSKRSDRLQKLVPTDGGVESEKADHLSTALLRSMLRLRNFTGSSFQSAAHHTFQEHDTFKGQRRNEEKKQ